MYGPEASGHCGAIAMRWFCAASDVILAVHVHGAKLNLQSAPVSSSTESQNGERWKN